MLLLIDEKHFNPETPTRPRPSRSPALPDHPGESLNSVQALQRDERRKDEDIKDEEY